METVKLVPTLALVLAAALSMAAGPASAQVQIQPIARPGARAILAAGPAPTGVSAVPLAPNAARVAWQPVASATLYRVQRSDTPGAPFYDVTDVAATAASFDDSGLVPRSTVSYRVQAVYDARRTSPGTSDAVSVTLPPAVQPARLQARASGPDRVTLTWPAPPGASGYAIMRYAGGYWEPINSGQLVRSPTYTDTGVGPGTYTYQVIAYYVVGRGETEGDLQGIPRATVSVGPRSGTYRITITGFTVDQPTGDHVLQADGKGDEVWIRVDGFEVDAAGTKGPSWSRETSIYGDVQGYPARVGAGTAGSSGGLVAGDRVPDPPWALTGPAQASRLPLFVWQGILTEGHNAVFLAPSIWEWDGGGKVFGAWRDFTDGVQMAVNRALLVDHGIFDPVVRPALIILDGITSLPGSLETTASWLLGNGGDVPIGWLRRSGEQLQFDGGFLAFNQTLAESIATRDATGHGRGVYRLDFDATPLGMEGRYTLWLRVERLP